MSEPAHEDHDAAALAAFLAWPAGDAGTRPGRVGGTWPSAGAWLSALAAVAICAALVALSLLLQFPGVGRTLRLGGHLLFFCHL